MKVQSGLELFWILVAVLAVLTGAFLLGYSVEMSPGTAEECVAECERAGAWSARFDPYHPSASCTCTVELALEVDRD